MAKRYNRQALSDMLYELGEKLGRPPTPRDLTEEMPRKRTYLRHFGSWEEALEYAGYVGNEQPEEVETQSSASHEETPGLSTPTLINLLGKPIVFLTRNGDSETLLSSGKALLNLTTKQPMATGILGPVVWNVPIYTNHLKGIFVTTPEGERQDFPPIAGNVYYIVPEAIARNVYRFSRSSADLLYPGQCHYANGILYVETLGMVYTNKLLTV